MLYLPPLRRLLLPSLLCLAFILYYRSTVRIPSARHHLSPFIVRQPELSLPGTRIPTSELEHRQVILKNVSENYLSPPTHLYYHYNNPGATYDNGTEIQIQYPDPKDNPHLAKLFECPTTPNPITNHIKLPNHLFNISMVFRNETENERVGYLNPAIISLPFWSENQYLLVSRVATDGSHQQNLLCEANICYTGDSRNSRTGEKPCDERDFELLEGTTGMRCATPPFMLNVPPTPAEKCPENAAMMIDIPGFHDPRVYWSGKGEPLIMVNSQSRYACFGLWVIDLRRLHYPLSALLSSNPYHDKLGPLMSYPTLTEITRNPPDTRGAIEKNWMFFGSAQGSYVHYDMGPQKRTIAKLIGGGLTTKNLTDPREVPCLEDAANPSKDGTWHQATNSLRLILCERSNKDCSPTHNNQVFFSIIHHKHKGFHNLPLRYERYFIIWSAEPPFTMLGTSKHPMLMYNETANGFADQENWVDDPEHQALVEAGKKGKRNWADFTYTVSIGWAWGRRGDEPADKNVGYLDDEVLMGVGVDDRSMVYARATAQDLLQCIRACPPRATSPLYVSPEDAVQEMEKTKVEEEKFVNEVVLEDYSAEEDTVEEEIYEEGNLDDEVLSLLSNAEAEPTDVIEYVVTEVETTVAEAYGKTAATVTGIKTILSTVLAAATENVSEREASLRPVSSSDGASQTEIPSAIYDATQTITPTVIPLASQRQASPIGNSNDVLSGSPHASISGRPTPRFRDGTQVDSLTPAHSPTPSPRDKTEP